MAQSAAALTLPVYEYLSETEESVVYAAVVRLMPRRLAHPTKNDFQTPSNTISEMSPCLRRLVLIDYCFRGNDDTQLSHDVPNAVTIRWYNSANSRTIHERKGIAI